MKRDYIAIEPILYNNKRYEPGQNIPMEEDDAKQLLELGHVSLPDDVSNEAPPVPEGEERVAAIKSAIAGLNVDVAENWTQGGAPKTEAIAAITGWPVSGAERDAVWAELKPAK